MKDLERKYDEMVRKNRSTIYTVCYMFSNDQDEVADINRREKIDFDKAPCCEEWAVSPPT